MDKKQFAKIKKVGEVVAASGAVLVDPKATPAQKKEAVRVVDALHNVGASHAVRGYAATIDQSPKGTPEYEAIQKLSATMDEDRELEARLLKMKSFLHGE